MKEVFFYGYFVILVILSIYGFHRYYMIYLYRKYKDQNPVPKSQFKELPPITIQLPVFNEKYVVERLIEKVAMIRYPRNLLQIQVLDDSTDDTSTIAKKKCDEIRARGIDIAFIHRTDRSGFKAGALENGLKTATGEFVAVFDADFLPDEDFLEKTIHYFTDSKIGMVQARWDHENRRYSLLTECQSILLDGHFMIEHTARNRSEGSLILTGPRGCGVKHYCRRGRMAARYAYRRPRFKLQGSVEGVEIHIFTKCDGACRVANRNVGIQGAAIQMGKRFYTDLHEDFSKDSQIGYSIEEQSRIVLPYGREFRLSADGYAFAPHADQYRYTLQSRI